MRLAADFDDWSVRAEAPASHADLDRLSRLARESLGIDLRPFKSAILRQRLSHRIKELGLSGLGEYLDILEGPDTIGERDALISAITTNVTQFFREAHHFDLLARDVLPELLDRARSGGRVRLWSAGCSSGPEPYSIAACILRLCPEAPGLDLKILATDIDSAV
ncbi:MAG TPA: CheR family methyltransferase, partial [Rubellimicrobium sp.]|nr:CheR family methyltransferase [Rubellimicrobium sp.]